MINLGPTELNAQPVKAFFIEMLIRDIDLADAVAELVDNAVDGAKRMQRGQDYKGLWVKVTINDEQFIIEDNCGGISWQLAREQVFRFGRPGDITPVLGSVGRFGIGMKRATFKMGHDITLETTAESDRYKVHIDVEKWALDDSPESWIFEAEAPPEHPPTGTVYPEDARGTTITVKELRRWVAMQFGAEWFEISLQNKIRDKQNAALARGLEISINGKHLSSEKYRLISTSDIRPAWIKQSLNGSATPVSFRCIAGLSKPPNPSESAGWYVVCNGRTVLRGDKTELIGWSNRDLSIPAFHTEYGSFRGYAYFDSDDADRLPWNTTKTGIDEDSDIFRQALVLMLEAMVPVVEYIRKVHENTKAGGIQLKDHLSGTREVVIDQVSREGVFDATSLEELTPEVRIQRIQFAKPESEAWEVRKDLGVSSWKQVGEALFDYYREYEM